MTIGKLRLQWTHAFSADVDATVWVAGAQGFDYKTNLTGYVPGFGTLTPLAMSSGAWAEYGARIGYHISNNIELNAFLNGVSGDVGSGTKVHAGGGVKVWF